ncbi:alpha-amylase family protein [Mycetocola zhadangensis]|uniref:Alpha-amylase n=1 Tax=Mycetocola zhadangensis TaxID=1164595 RepID=A0A3L7J421_9MICO|nr:alpha-amylase family protein [Mycetocola zhadangensis]RLQ85333.1 alpha-amylase [Mycetocola zhadangensis]GGE81732.1 alpha-amylase [Mycetocola zhadangensis]
MPDWTEHVIWWHVYPLGFLGADTTGHDRTEVHRLEKLEPWLDYLIALGANGLALGPVFRSSTHGYDTIDYFEIDPRLGTNADLDHLIAAAHSRGIRVILDGVFNHVGREFAPLQTALSNPDAPENALFRYSGNGDLEVFEGHGALVALNHSNPEVAEYVRSVLDFWLDRGIDGWRLDAAYSVPTSFWAGVLPRVRERHPEVYLLGEVLHGDYAGFVRDGGLDSVTQYELWQAIWHSIADSNFFELDWALKRHNGFLESFAPYTFLGNHDVTRIATQIPDARHREHALVLLFTLGGTPAVYYGDERGFEAVKEERFGGDDAIRPAYPDSPAGLPSDGERVHALHQELMSVRRRYSWVHRATSTPLELTNTSYVYEVRAGSERLVVALNLGDDAVVVSGSNTPGLALVAGSADRGDNGCSVPPHAWAILA